MKYLFIGDIHGCFLEMIELIHLMGGNSKKSYHPYLGNITRINPPRGYCFVFVGDLINKGPNSVDVLLSVLDAIDRRVAMSVLGNHDELLRQYLKMDNVGIKEEFFKTITALESRGENVLQFVREHMKNMPYMLEFQKENILVSHCGLDTPHQNISLKSRIRSIYGYKHHDWAQNYQGKIKVIHGHLVVNEAVERNNTINLDTGCYMGLALSGFDHYNNKFYKVKSRQPIISGQAVYNLKTLDFDFI